MADIIVGTVKNISTSNYDMFTGETLIPGQELKVLRSTPMEAWYRYSDDLSADVAAGLIEVIDLDSNPITADNISTWIVADADDTQVFLVNFMSNQRVPGSGERYIKWHASITTTDVSLALRSRFLLVGASLSVNNDDNTNEYGIRIYEENDLVTPVYESGVILPTLSYHGRQIIPFDINTITLGGVGTYVVAVYRVTGSGNSDFNKMRVSIALVPGDQ